jgi:hypothetical protein
VFFTYTTLLPGTHSAFTILNGPEPVGSSMFLNASVFAMRSGMMNGTLDEGFPSASSTSGNGFFSLSVNVLSLTAVHEAVASPSFCPSASRFDQRSIDAMQSAERTGAPSWNLSPSRSVNVCVS